MTGRFGIYPALILASAALLMVQGCVREDIGNLGSGDMRIRIGAKVEAAKVSTKADIDYDYQGEDLPIDLIRWDENIGGDSPAGRSELAATMSGTPSNDGSWNREIKFDVEAQFYLNRTDSVGFAGWYPGKNVSGNGWELQDGAVIRSDNTMIYNLMTDNGLDTETDVMVGDFTAGTYTSGIPSMQFRHALCMYNFYVYAVDELTEEEWGGLEKLSLTNLPDKVIINLPDDLTCPEDITFGYEDNAGDKIPYDILNAPDNPRELPVGMPSTSQEAYIGTVLGGAPVKGVLGIRAETTEQKSGNSVSIARNFKPGYTYNIFLRFSSRGIINAEVSASDWQYNGNDYVIDQNFELLTDLSRYGTANSYIVSSANRGYCFTGTVKGNGESGNILTGRDGSTIRLDVSGVNLDVHHIGIVRSDAMMKKTANGWVMLGNDERKNTPLIELVSDQLSNGRVIFKVPGNPDDKNDFSLQYKGNVKIAAFDANGNIVWSWHIWITDKPQNQGYSNGYVALDRNLGAVTDDCNTYRKEHSAWSGLYYQWGRKDPIFRATVDGSPDNPWLVDGKADISETPGTMRDVTRNPVTYYFDKSGGNSWLSDTDPGYRNFDHFWGYVSVRDDIVKTIYDPCPPGYRVPGNALWEDPSEGMTHDIRNNAAGDFAGFNFNIDGMIDIYYPGTSCIVSNGGNVLLKDNDIVGNNTDGEYVFLHSATPYEPEDGQTGSGYQDLAYHFRYSAAQGTEYNSVLVAGPGYHSKRSDAYPVRCVFENSAPEITNLSENQTANCYVVSKSGFYEFDASVRGNGVTALNVVTAGGSEYRAFDAGMGSFVSGTDHIGVLWWQGDLKQGSWWRSFISSNPSNDEIDDNCPVIVLDDGTLVDGKPLLYIRVNENTCGNVGLAAYAENGDILWTWHIWIQPGITNVSLGDYTLMDRNLGATYCPGTNESYNSENRFAGYGFCYQWGRKDPFFQPETDGTSNGAKSQPWYENTNGIWNLRRENRIGQQKTIPESVKAPLYFCAANENRWQTTYPNGNGQINDLWGYVGMTGDQGSSFAKTMYDPCPPGYKVMQHDVFLSGHICAADHDLQFSFNKESDYGIYLYNGLTITQRTDNTDYNMQYGGWVGKQTAASAGGIWFPNARAMNSNGLYNSSNSYRLSSATPFSGESSREIRWWNNSGEYRIQQNHGNNQNWMSDGRVVRCQME